MSNSTSVGKAFHCPYDNTVVGSPNSCTGEVKYDQFNYNPHVWVGALFTALFGVTFALHLFQALVSRRWFMLLTVVACAVAETLGWAGRLWAAVSVEWLADNGGHYHSNYNAFMIQIAVLIIAPAFLSAGWYIMLGRLIRGLGPQYCRFSPRTYAIVFVSGDVLSLVIQALGGGIAAGAKTKSAANHGANIMVIGIFTQVAIMIAYSLLFAEFVVRYRHQRPVRQFRFRRTRPDAFVRAGSIPEDVKAKARTLLAAMVISTVLIFVRSIYRCIELLDGWNGPIISNESLFAVLDGLMVLLALAVFNAVHPGSYLPRAALGEDDQGSQAVSLEAKA